MSTIRQAISSNPLSVMLLQVQFSPIVQIKKHIPAFQEYLQGIEYPLYSLKETDILHLGQHGKPEKTVLEQWRFSSSDTQQAIIFDSEKLTYQVFVVQSGPFDTILQSFLTIVKEFDSIAEISLISRLGLRYIHSIQEKDDVSWKDMVTKEFQGPSFPADGDWIENELRFISAQRGVFLKELTINSNFRYKITQNILGRKYPEGIERFPSSVPEYFDPKCLVTHLDLDHFVIFYGSSKLEVFDRLPDIFCSLNSVIEEMFFGAMLIDKAKEHMAVVSDYSIPDSSLAGPYPPYAREAGAVYGYKESDAGSSTQSGQTFSMKIDTGRFDNLIETSVNPKNTHKDLVLKNHNEQFASLSRFFGFNKTEWAEIFSVSRPTIYGWLKNELKPSGDNANKISRLYSLLNAIPNRHEDDRLFRGYIHHHISVYNCSLYEVFKSDLQNDVKVPELVYVLSSLLEKSRQKYKELDDLKNNGNASKSTFDYNMKRLFS